MYIMYTFGLFNYGNFTMAKDILRPELAFFKIATSSQFKQVQVICNVPEIKVVFCIARGIS